MAAFEASVVPNSKAFSAAFEADGRLKVRLTEKAEENRANAELVRGLSRILGAPVRIVRGAKGRRKVLAVDLDAAEIKRRVFASAEGKDVQKSP